MRALTAYGLLATFTVVFVVLATIGVITLVPLALAYNFVVEL